MNKQMTQKQVAAKGFAAIAAAGFLTLLLGVFGLGAAQPAWAQSGQIAAATPQLQGSDLQAQATPARGQTFVKNGNTYKVTMNSEEEPAPTGTEPAGYEYEAWKAKFVNLPKYHEGTLIKYTCTETETSVITGTDGPGTYAYTVTGNATAGFTVTNTHTPETTTATVTKVWDDADNQDGIRPETLTLTLNGAPEGTTVPAPAVTKKGNSWTYTWSGLPKYENGTEIRYTVTENSVPAWYPVSGSPAQNGGTITNTHTPTPPPPPPPPGPPGGPPVVPPDEIDDDDVPLAGFGTVNQVGDCYE